MAHEGGSGTCKCGHKHCPSTRYADGRCDVHEEPGPYRLRSLKKFSEYVKHVDEQRKKAGKKPLDFARAAAPETAAKVNVHSVDEEDDEEDDDAQWNIPSVIEANAAAAGISRTLADTMADIERVWAAQGE